MGVKNRIIIQGGGGHARVVIDCLHAMEVDVLALFDPKYTGSLMGIEQLGAYQPDFEKDAKAVVAIGDNAVRKKVAAITKHHFSNVIHPSVILSRFAKIGLGNMIVHGAIIQAQAVIGNHVIVNTGARIDHDCIIEDYVHLAPGTVLCGTVTVGEGTLVGAGAVIIPGIRVGKWSVIGAGSVVVSDVPDYAVVVGNPARVIKYIQP